MRAFLVTLCLVAAGALVAAGCGERSSGGGSGNGPTKAPTKADDTPTPSEGGDTAEPAKASTATAEKSTGDAAPTAESGDGGPAKSAEEAADAGPAAPETFEVGGLKLTEFVLAKNVVERQPVDPTNTFSKSGESMVWVFIRLENADRTETELHVTFERVGVEHTGHPIKLRVPASPRYVTFARTGTRYLPGRYQAVVRTPDGQMLGRAEYDLVE